MDDKNKLEDFLRKKLNEFDDSNDGWDKPDANVWGQAQVQIPAMPKSSLISGTAMLTMAFLLLLLVSGGYIWHLQQEIGVLKTELNSEKTQVQQANVQIAISEKTHQQELSAGLSEKAVLQASGELAADQKGKLAHLVPQQKQAISRLEKENITLKQNALKNQITVQADNAVSLDITSELAENPQREEAVIFAKQDIALLPQKQHDLVWSAVLDFNLPALIIPVKASQNRFEIGYEYALLGQKIPVQSDLKDKTTTTNNPINKTVFTNSHGVFFAFSPKRNWFLRTGIRTASLSLEQYQKSGVYYDKSSEYHKPDGTTVNDLSLNSRTPYSELESEITLAIPSDADLKTGDWVAFTTYERFQQRYFQVPIGIEYFHGKGRLQWQLQSGVQWNKVVFDNYLLKAWAESKSKDMLVDNVKVLTKDIPSKQFFGVYAGIGVNYHITNSWHARAGMTYNYDFINNNQTGNSTSQLIGNAFRLGLNYRF